MAKTGIERKGMKVMIITKQDYLGVHVYHKCTRMNIIIVIKHHNLKIHIYHTFNRIPSRKSPKYRYLKRIRRQLIF